MLTRPNVTIILQSIHVLKSSCCTSETEILLYVNSVSENPNGSKHHRWVQIRAPQLAAVWPGQTTGTSSAACHEGGHDLPRVPAAWVKQGQCLAQRSITVRSNGYCSEAAGSTAHRRASSGFTEREHRWLSAVVWWWAGRRRNRQSLRRQTSRRSGLR